MIGIRNGIQTGQTTEGDNLRENFFRVSLVYGMGALVFTWNPDGQS